MAVAVARRFRSTGAGYRRARLLRSIRVGFWLGWKIESNWTDPLLFFVYVVVRPLGAALILVAMFHAVSGGRRGPLLDFFVVGSAFWPFVLSGIQGLAIAALDDREHWRMTRPVYTAPISWRAFLIGRSLALSSSVGVGGALVTLLVGRFVLGVPIGLRTPDAGDGLGAILGGAGSAAAALLLGAVAVVAVGLLALAFVLGVSSDAWRLPDALSTALYLVSGAVFPVSVLPGALQGVSRLVPLTWWLEALRRALLGPGARVSFPGLSDGQVLGLLASSTAVAFLFGLAAFSAAERRARRLGLLDRETAY